MMSQHKASLQTLIFVIILVTPWASDGSIAVQALCAPQQTISSPLQTRFHAATRHRSHYDPSCKATADDHERTIDEHPLDQPRTTSMQRKSFLHTLSRALLATTSGASAVLLPSPNSKAHAAANSKEKPSLPISLAKVQEARVQMEPIPSLIKSEKWDSVRAILGTPPLSDCWMKTSRPLLQDYATALAGDPTGAINDDAEFDALMYKEEALDHLRFLDMSAYNNVFNPIKAEGESGASKELVKSYYEDPTREYTASIAAIDGLIKLTKVQ